jgi:hypothetical protein
MVAWHGVSCRGEIVQGYPHPYLIDRTGKSFFIAKQTDVAIVDCIYPRMAIRYRQDINNFNFCNANMHTWCSCCYHCYSPNPCLHFFNKYMVALSLSLFHRSSSSEHLSLFHIHPPQIYPQNIHFSLQQVAYLH